MFIQTEETPNPATLKFLPGRVVMERGTADFDAADKAARSPLAESLFRIDGVARIFLGSDFVTVTKTDAEGLAGPEAADPRPHHGAFLLESPGHSIRR